MRQILQPDGIAPRQQQARLQYRQLIIAGERAHLPPGFSLGIGRDAVERTRVLVEDDAVAGQDDPHGRQYIVEDRLGWERTPQLAADRVDRAGCTHRGPDGALEPAKVFLVTPVHPDAVGDGRCGRLPPPDPPAFDGL